MLRLWEPSHYIAPTISYVFGVMEQFSIRGLPQLLQASGRLDSLSRRVDKFSFYDKCNWVITTIARKNFVINKSFDNYVEIHSARFKKVLGADYYPIILNTLIHIELIEVNNSYSTKRFTKSYRLTQLALEKGIVIDIMRNKQFESRVNCLVESDYKEVVKNPVFEKILYNTAQLQLLNEPYYYVQRLLPDTKYEEVNGYLNQISEPYNEFQMKRYDDFYKGFRALNNTSTPLEVYKSPLCFKPTLSEYGRVYHIAASIPKHIRTCMRTKDNELLWEVDMSSAQLSLLVMEWLKELKSNNVIVNKEMKEEITLHLDLLNKGGFYQYIQDNSKVCSEMEYSLLKFSILKTLNQKTYPSKLFKELKRLFPHFIGFIVHKKVPNHEEVSHIGMRAESSIFIDEYMALPKEIFALPIHDCILVKEKNVKMVKERLIKRTKAIYKGIIPDSLDLQGLFKIDRVSLLDEQTHDYQLEKWHEEIKDEDFL